MCREPKWWRRATQQVVPSCVRKRWIKTSGIWKRRRNQNSEKKKKKKNRGAVIAVGRGPKFHTYKDLPACEACWYLTPDPSLHFLFAFEHISRRDFWRVCWLTSYTAKGPMLSLLLLLGGICFLRSNEPNGNFSIAAHNESKFVPPTMNKFSLVWPISFFFHKNHFYGELLLMCRDDNLLRVYRPYWAHLGAQIAGCQPLSW